MLPEKYFEEFSFDITGPGEISNINNIKELIFKNKLQKN